MMIITLLIVPVFTRQSLPDNQVFMVNLIDEQKTVKYQPPKSQKAEKPPVREEIEPPEPEEPDEEEPELSIPKVTPEPTKKQTPVPTPKPTKKATPKPTPKPTKKPEPQKTEIKTEARGDKGTDSEKETTTGTKGSVSIDTGQRGIEFPFSYYTKQIRDLVYFNWNNPLVDLKKGEKITASVKFIIRENGEIEKTKISKTSGNVIYDMAAIRSVKQSSPCPPLPLPYLMNFKTLTVTMDFTYSPQE